MATNLSRLYKTAADVLQVRTAAAPSGGVYIVEGDIVSGLTADANLMRLSSAGAVVWSKLVSVTGGTQVQPWVASNGNYVAVAYENDAGDEGVILYNSSGTVQWSTAVPLNHIASTGAAQRQTPPIAVGPDNSVFVFGSDASNEAILTKLNASTGAVVWSANLRQSGVGATSDFKGALAVLSGGDLIVTIKGTLNYVLRLSGSTGAVSWSKGIVWPSGSSETNIGIDASDNIYLVGMPHTSGTKVLPVVKLDSSGSTLWNRQVAQGAWSSLAYQFEWNGRLTCDSTGVYIPTRHLTSTGPFGHIFVPAAGTVATSNALAASFATLGGGGGPVGASGGTDVASLFAYADKASGGATYWDAIVVSAGSAASEDGAWGGRARTTYGFDVQNGSATISTQTYTRATNPSFSASSFSYTESATTLLVETYVATYLVTAASPSTAFGSPRVYGYADTDPYTISTAFGTPHLVSLGAPTSVGPFTAFGTATQTWNRTLQATALDPTLTFGVPYATRTLGPPPHVSDSTNALTAFGTPVSSGTIACPATGANTTLLGTPVLALPLAVTGFAVGARGTPTAACRGKPAPLIEVPGFGLPMTAGFGGTTGTNTTLFGTPTVRTAGARTATGFSATAIGTPSALRNAQRTRSGVFRTQWGKAQAERTAP